MECPPAALHRQFSGHNIATFTGTITNHNQDIKTGVAKSSDINITVSLDDIASCCNLQERGTDIECYCVGCEGLGRAV